MAISRVLLFYKFTPIADPQAIKLWQWDLCERLKLRGRILISQHGINGTVGGTIQACKAYVKRMKQYPEFADIEWKISEGLGTDADGYASDFPRLSVKVRKEIVAFGAPDELEVDENGIVGGGRHVRPEEVEQIIAQNPDLVFFDGRNAIEAQVGRFDGAIVPPTSTTHDFISLLDSGEYDDLKDKPILAYCTGGIRCEVLTALMKKRGFSKVMQLHGGIVRYGEMFGNTGRWKGSLTVFDNREVMDFDGGDVSLIGTCHSCGASTNTLHNCDEPSCRERLVTCQTCAQQPVFCQEHAVALA
ncbi:rhodanese-related sulfurtransferase [Arcanobacterium pinnipediorum]|uniref:tRNA uridine(34) hydroxylase n=1 Tax=Arcanobacterium pinnipediorum TaxID=1503041 RepID=A0ABY5AH46_9ACTO|nr:rhodanese-related sulfurtransferase [Arcanobacterium pinnipediorum]USR79243.1 rhodanese-related sulfurtransferase [Arcanobacterium pinnipediorum]